MKKIDLSIIIPIYNEEESIVELYQQINKAIQNKLTYELIFINDGSTDNSFSVIKQLLLQDDNVKIISFTSNKGKSEALNYGFNNCSGNIVITIDGDLQDDPMEFFSLIEKINSGSDMVTGWKKDRKDSISKKILSKIFNFVLRVLTGIKIHDFNCGLKAYRSSVVKSIEIFGGRHRYIPALAGQLGFPVSEIVVNHRPRIHGETKYGGSRVFHGFFDLLTILFLNKYTQQPLHFFGAIGMVAFSGGIITELIVLYYKFIIFEPFSKHIALLLLGVILIIIGIQFFSIGLLGEIMARFSQDKEDRIKEIK